MTKLTWLILIALVAPGLWGLLVYLVAGRWLISGRKWPEQTEASRQTGFLDYQI